MFSKTRHAFITAHGCSISFAAHGSPGGGRPISFKTTIPPSIPHRIPIPRLPHYISLTEPLRLLNSVVSSHHRPCSSSHLPPYPTQIDLAACRAAASSSPLRTTAPRNPSPGLSSTEARRVEFLASQSSSAAASLASLLSSLVVLDLRGRAADPPELGLISSFAAVVSATESKTLFMEAGRMDQPCMAAINSQPLVADVEAVKKASGDMPATMGSGCFDCNICLDFAAEPVVTLCGHLYCWPCIYEWLRPGVESTASDNSSSARRQCPVCKATLSPDTLVPLYGRGGSSKKSLTGMSIPRRPTVHRETVEHHNTQSNVNDQQHHQSMETNPPHQPLRHAHYHPSSTGFDFIYPPAPLGRGLIHSTAGGVLGGMAEAVLPLVLGGQLPASLYYTSPYHVAAQNVNPRLRRHQMEIERSLHQIWFFLFVFVVLCLLLF